MLEERIFESLSRAKLPYPELFQPSETREAERAASEAEVLRIESEVAHDMILTSDDEDGDDRLPEDCQPHVERERSEKLVKTEGKTNPGLINSQQLKLEGTNVEDKE